MLGKSKGASPSFDWQGKNAIGLRPSLDRGSSPGHPFESHPARGTIFSSHFFPIPVSYVTGDLTISPLWLRCSLVDIKFPNSLSGLTNRTPIKEGVANIN